MEPIQDDRPSELQAKSNAASDLEPIQDDRASIKTWTWPLIQYHHDKHGVWADSPDVPGWSCAADDVAGVDALIEEAKEFIFIPNGWPRHV